MPESSNNEREEVTVIRMRTILIVSIVLLAAGLAACGMFDGDLASVASWSS